MSVCLGVTLGCQNFCHLELSSHYTSTSPAIYPGSLLSHSGHVFESIPIITRNLRHTIIAYIYVQLGLSSDCSVRVEFG